ncbi:DUF2280 domain-containing protein [Pectobacterium carotovorum subsp. carotovorum]|nr:DUF2280 domain-containing protein [Pectobacterium carotovorum subsp. carotovorum]MCL6349205.1 DUF2280 domain-containing protein [Pectobacterium carotovorum subsp. carotovorum]MCL6403714.1 DUF2280 domain-containing protein [Pectobacterium carotovorum subsp. carotovorum]
MAALSADIKAFIVQALACFDSPTQVVKSVKVEFGIDITRQQIESHDPTKANGRKLASRWVEMFNQTRSAVQEETSTIAIANKAYRLRSLDRMASEAERMKNYPMAAKLIEQAARECGDAYRGKPK